jgi:hypothetical protein
VHSASEPGWGSRTLLLDLPAGSVHFSGLSSAQFNALYQTYSRFANAGAPHVGRAIECAVYQLASPLNISLQVFAVEGLYTPRKRRSERGIDLTGVNFKASIPTDSLSDLASLGIAREDELAEPRVVENFLRVLAAHHALQLGGAILHSAGLVFDEQAYIFVGRSGAGKTTLTRKAHEYGATVLSDDINLVLPHAGGYHAYAVPFTGEFGQTLDHAAAAVSYPVAAIVLLEQADHLAAHCPGSANAVARLMVGSPFVNNDEHETNRLLENLIAMVGQLPVVQLLNRREDKVSDIMDTIKGALSRV